MHVNLFAKRMNNAKWVKSVSRFDAKLSCKSLRGVLSDGPLVHNEEGRVLLVD